MTVQLSLEDAMRERDAGIQQSIDHANAVDPDWSEKAYALLLDYIENVPGEFMVEDLRAYAAMKDFPLPPSARAWGQVIVRAAKSGLVSNAGYSKTKNKKAHRTPAAMWLPVKKAS